MAPHLFVHLSCFEQSAVVPLISVTWFVCSRLGVIVRNDPADGFSKMTGSMENGGRVEDL